MSNQRTLAIIKPDAVEKQAIGAILDRIQKAGLAILGLRMLKLTKEDADAFYKVHVERPFYGSLTDYMSSGPIVAVALEGEEAIKKLRDLMGATDPARADDGTIRKDFAESIERNAIHGSDSEPSVAYELPFFFRALDLPR